MRLERACRSTVRTGPRRCRGQRSLIKVFDVSALRPSHHRVTSVLRRGRIFKRGSVITGKMLVGAGFQAPSLVFGGWCLIGTATTNTLRLLAVRHFPSSPSYSYAVHLSSKPGLGRVHTKRSASKMSANEMNPRKITSSFSKRRRCDETPPPELFRASLVHLSVNSHALVLRGGTTGVNPKANASWRVSPRMH